MSRRALWEEALLGGWGVAGMRPPCSGAHLLRTTRVMPHRAHNVRLEGSCCHLLPISEVKESGAQSSKDDCARVPRELGPLIPYLPGSHPCPTGPNLVLWSDLQRKIPRPHPHPE